MKREVKIIQTEDGSHSLFVPELNETYHSFHGAYRESIHVFMLYGLEAWYSRNPDRFPIRIFELGFGTGLNAWLTLVWAEQYHVPVLYHTIEPFPLEKEIYSQLNYIEVDTSIYHYAPYFKRLHEAPWNEGRIFSEYFNMKKDQTTLAEAVLYPADVVFFDAFAPNKQPELWTKEALGKVVDAMNPGGIFVTYCAKGQVKRDLAELGLTVETLPGPPGKKEMVRATKPGG
jgi:tRNA U34 5-methylaminomethyl-2-thiouridine-forming methyltransferase MnmC